MYENQAKQQYAETDTAQPVHAGSITALLSDQRGLVAELHGTIDGLEKDLDDVLFHGEPPTQLGAGGTVAAPNPVTSPHGAVLREQNQMIQQAINQLRRIRNQVAA